MDQTTHRRRRNVFGTLRDDIRSTDFHSTIRQEARETKEYFLTVDQRTRLLRMNRLKRWFFVAWWILRAMFFTLTPFRRLLFVVGVILLLTVQRSTEDNSNNSLLLGATALVLLIILEVKDKMMAHDELEAGRRIQQALMPERTPTVPGWSAWIYSRSANEVGGDLVDVLRISSDRFGFALADVSGKGLHAALLMAKLQATIRALAFDGESVSAMVTRVNAIFHRDSPANMFASLVYAECSANSGDLRLVNAGHLPPLVRRAQSIDELSKGLLAIGLAANTTYSVESLQLQQGESLVLYSDGVVEAKNPAGEFFGKDRLLAQLSANRFGSAEQLGTALLAAIARFVDGAPPTDDLSMIILHRM